MFGSTTEDRALTEVRVRWLVVRSPTVLESGHLIFPPVLLLPLAPIVSNSSVVSTST